MIHRTVAERQMRRSRAMTAGALAMLGLLAVSLLDRAVYDAITWPPERRAAGELEDWYQMLRTAGYLPAWLAAGRRCSRTCPSADACTCPPAADRSDDPAAGRSGDSR